MSYILDRELQILPHPFVIITEGMGDARFVDRLLQFNKITHYSVGCPSDQTSGGTGKTAFAKYLSAIQTARARGKSTKMRGILVVADSDENSSASFDFVIEAMQEAAFPIPGHPYEAAEENGFRTGVYLMPGDNQPGTLEHLLLKAVFEKNPGLEKCLTDFATCTGGMKSPKINMQAKMKMSALAAAFCVDNPWCSLGPMWSDAGNPVPIDSPLFSPFTNFVGAFAA